MTTTVCKKCHRYQSVDIKVWQVGISGQKDSRYVRYYYFLTKTDAMANFMRLASKVGEYKPVKYGRGFVVSINYGWVEEESLVELFGTSLVIDYKEKYPSRVLVSNYE
tara:strand:+ start:19871 stop:20194 length:324 start_codon:yes stop_codon:yes gene_type:complete